MKLKQRKHPHHLLPLISQVEHNFGFMIEGRYEKYSKDPEYQINMGINKSNRTIVILIQG